MKFADCRDGETNSFADCNFGELTINDLFPGAFRHAYFQTFNFSDLISRRSDFQIFIFSDLLSFIVIDCLSQMFTI